ncbi:MAG: extracellular solute-binding protein [Vallitaleaceae bacterium]|nr:extracellular solute-binding protein [Vallitaleaceae bacterium]
MKKLLSLLLALTLMASLFVGCAKKEATTVAEPVDLLLWEQMDPVAQTAFDEIAAAFTAVNPKITVTRTHYETEDLRTSFQNASIAGDGTGPTFVYGPNDNVGLFYTSQVIQPITNVLSSEFIATIDQTSLDGTKVDGDYWMLPDINGNQIAMVYNKALVKEAPTTWDELIAAAVANTDVAGEKYGLVFNEKEPYWFVGFYNGYGGKVMDDKNNPTLNNEAMVKALQFAKDVRAKYELGLEGMDYDISDSLFKAGQAAILFNGAWSWSGYTDAGIDIGIAKGPVLPGTDSTPIWYNATKGYLIPTYVEDANTKAALQKFFDFLFSPENNAKMALAVSQAPTVTKARDLDIIKNDPLQKVAIETIEATTGMPIVAEMRGIWDAMRPELEAVLFSDKDPAQAAADMQTAAEGFIAEIRGE